MACDPSMVVIAPKSSLQSLERSDCRGEERDRRFSKDLCPAPPTPHPHPFFFSFFAGGYRKQFQREQGRRLFDVVRPAFPLPTMVSPTPRGGLKVGCGEPVTPVTRLNHSRFLWQQRRLLQPFSVMLFHGLKQKRRKITTTTTTTTKNNYQKQKAQRGHILDMQIIV